MLIQTEKVDKNLHYEPDSPTTGKLWARDRQGVRHEVTIDISDGPKDFEGRVRHAQEKLRDAVDEFIRKGCAFQTIRGDDPA